MSNIIIQWYGPKCNAQMNRKVLTCIKKHCCERICTFTVFALIHDAPSKNNFHFFVRNRVFLAKYLENVLLAIEDEDLSIKELQNLLNCKRVEYHNLHFVEEFENFLNRYCS